MSIPGACLLCSRRAGIKVPARLGGLKFKYPISRIAAANEPGGRPPPVAARAGAIRARRTLRQGSSTRRVSTREQMMEFKDQVAKASIPSPFSPRGAASVPTWTMPSARRIRSIQSLASRGPIRLPIVRRFDHAAGQGDVGKAAWDDPWLEGRACGADVMCIAGRGRARASARRRPAENRDPADPRPRRAWRHCARNRRRSGHAARELVRR